MPRSGALATLAVLLACALPAGARADAAQTVSGERGGATARIALDPRTGRGLIAYFVRADQGDLPAAEVVVRPLGRRGRLSGPERTVGAGAAADPSIGGEPLAIAFDSRRRRYLIAYAAYEPGMATREYVTPFPVVRRMKESDREIFVALVDAAGRPLGAPRRISDTGPADRTDTRAGAPTLAYDPRADAYALVYTGLLEPSRGRLHGAVISAGGEEIGADRALELRPEPASTIPHARVTADGRGGHLLAFVWGEGFQGRELYSTTLDPLDLGADPARLVSPAGGPGVSFSGLAWDPSAGSALVTWGEAIPGSTASRARRLRRDGRPASGTVRAPSGTFPAADPGAGGWLFARRRQIDPVRSLVTLQRARRDGRPAGRAVGVSDGTANAFEPVAVALVGRRRAGVLVAWTEVAGPDFVPRVMLRRVSRPGG